MEFFQNLKQNIQRKFNKTECQKQEYDRLLRQLLDNDLTPEKRSEIEKKSNFSKDVLECINEYLKKTDPRNKESYLDLKIKSFKEFWGKERFFQNRN